MSEHGIEPSLDELLADNVARLLMARDGVQEGDLRKLIGAVMRARRELQE